MLEPADLKATCARLYIREFFALGEGLCACYICMSW